MVTELGSVTARSPIGDAAEQDLGDRGEQVRYLHRFRDVARGAQVDAGHPCTGRHQHDRYSREGGDRASACGENPSRSSPASSGRAGSGRTAHRGRRAAPAPRARWWPARRRSRPLRGPGRARPARRHRRRRPAMTGRARPAPTAGGSCRISPDEDIAGQPSAHPERGKCECAAALAELLHDVYRHRQPASCAAVGGRPRGVGGRSRANVVGATHQHAHRGASSGRGDARPHVNLGRARGG